MLLLNKKRRGLPVGAKSKPAGLRQRASGPAYARSAIQSAGRCHIFAVLLGERQLNKPTTKAKRKDSPRPRLPNIYLPRFLRQPLVGETIRPCRPKAFLIPPFNPCGTPSRDIDDAVAMHIVTENNDDVEAPPPPTNGESLESSGSTHEIQAGDVSSFDVESFATANEAALEELIPQLSRRGTINPDSPYFSTEKFIRHMLIKADQQGLKRRQSGVCFRSLVVLGYGSEFAHQNTVGTAATSILRIGDTIRQRRHPPIKTILHSMDGVVHQGEMLLVLGKPGAGATTLLKTIAGETRGYADVSGGNSCFRDDIYDLRYPL